MKKRQIVLYAAIMFMLMCTSVYATISGSISLTPSTTDSLYAGEEFTVTLSLNDVDSSTGITAIEGYININENVLEDLTVKSIVTDSNGQVTINSDNVLTVYNIDDGDESSINSGITFSSNLETEKGDYKIVIDFETPITSSVDLLTITFKVKSGVVTGTYTNAISYELFEIVSPASSGATILETQSLDITIGSTSSSDNNNNNNTSNNNAINNNNSNNSSNNNSNNNASNNSSNNVVNNVSNNANANSSGNSTSNTNTSSNQTDNTVASGSLPLAGYKVFILPLIVATIAGFVFYKKYNQYKQF